MTNIKLHLNKRFGKLTVIRKSDNKIHNRISVVCICDCGNLKEVTTNSLVRGNVKSCGCIRKLKNNNNKHGLSKSALYICWSNIKSRCKDLSNKDYGGRGIFICKEWNDNFVNFMDWANKNNWHQGMEIDRINNNYGYFPDNCRVVSRVDNVRNRRNTIYLEFNGIKKPMSEWAELNGIKYGILAQRIFKLKMPIEKALTNKKFNRWQSQ